jgi:DNA-binding transcriptional LysR family regulator
MDLRRVELFVRVVERGSFTAAASQLGLPKSSVSRGVAHLEQDLGIALLRRSTRRIGLTDAGRVYFEQAKRALASLEEAASTASDLGRDPEGVVRVTAPADLGPTVAPLLTEFGRLHPRIRVDVSLSARTVDLVQEGFDLALRAARALADSTLVARRVATMDLGLFASKDYVRRRGKPERLADLTEHDCILFRSRDGRGVFELRGPRGDERVELSAKLWADDIQFILEAVLAGAGVALLPSFVVQHLHVRTQLVRLLPQLCGHGSSLFVVVPSMRYLPARVALLRTFFIERLSGEGLSEVQSRLRAGPRRP